MNSEWWDSFFQDLYNRLTNTLAIVLTFCVSLRVFMCICISFEIGLGSPQIEMTMIKVLLVCLLKFCENKSVMTKKITLYTAIEIMNVFYKYLSVCVYQGESILYCTCSTIFTVLFQTSIFQSDYLS